MMNFETEDLLRRKSTPFCHCGVAGLLLGLFLLSVVSLARGSSFKMLPTLPVGALSDFAIADFDGDQQPDFAIVQAGRSTLRDSRYLICFQFSTGSRQTIGLTAPVGGLQLDSRDVNGDQLTDLIVSTTWFGRPVAILLNDGHGSFTVVDPSEFPGAVPAPRVVWSEPSSPPKDVTAIPPSRTLPKILHTRYTGVFAEDDRQPAFRPSSCVHVLKRTVNTSGRAPPTAILHV